MRTRILIPALLATLLAACGGGGGGGGATAPAAVDPTPVAPAPATVSSIVPDAAMTWSTTGQPTLAITVHNADGSPAANAAVRVFSMSRGSPQDGAALGEPVPVSLLDSAPADANGHIDLSLRLPGELSEVLVVATSGDTRASSAVSLASASANLTLGH